MRLSRSESLGRSLAGALVALLAMVVLGPGAARASCSHYALLKHADVSGESAGFELLELSAGPQGAVANPVRPLPTPGRPCTGAFCSGNPATPAPSVPPSTIPSDRFCLSHEPLPLPAAGSFHRDANDPPVIPTHAGTDVFHPPRHSAAIA